MYFYLSSVQLQQNEKVREPLMAKSGYINVCESVVAVKDLWMLQSQYKTNRYLNM